MNNKVLYQLNIEDFLSVKSVNKTNKEMGVIRLIKCIQPRG